MIEKTGDFREGESRSDFDMTKIATHTDGFKVGTENELKTCKSCRRIRPSKPEESKTKKD